MTHPQYGKPETWPDWYRAPGGVVKGLRPYAAEEIARRMIQFGPPRSTSNLRPGWLADDQEWTHQLRALDPADVSWFQHHWEMAGGGKPQVDTSWITYETIDGARAGGFTWVGCLSLVLLLPVVAAILLTTGVVR